jgi:hypothetical protein
MFCCDQPADAQPAALTELLAANRYELTVQNGEMDGPGAAFLKREISAAQFVAIGEEHGTREVPQFVWAACRAMAQGGLDAMAIEAGPLVTAKLAQWVSGNDGRSNLLGFEQRYPDSIAFFYWRDEFELLAHCNRATAPKTLHFWGLDQEFLGSPQFILERILATRPGVQAALIAQRLQALCALATQRGMASGNWQDACMLQLSPADLARLKTAVERTKNRRAQELTAALIKTAEVYSLHEGGHAYHANRERSQLLKHNFLEDYQQFRSATGKPPRVLLKFGANHLFKGFDETNINDLGNFVAEFADGLGVTSLHIEVLGIRGEVAAKFGPGQPDRAVEQETAPGAFAALYAAAYPHRWTVLDLRPLRSEFAHLGQVDREVERLILGYDLLVLVPEVTAQAAIQ